VDFSVKPLQEAKGTFFGWGVALMIFGVLSFLFTDLLTHHFYLTKD